MAKREPHWVKLFLRELGRTGNVRVAAERAGVDFTTAYQRRKRHSDFAERWEEALRAFAEAPPPPAFTPPVPAALDHGEEGGLIVRPSEGGSGLLVRAPNALSSPRWGKRAEERFLTELSLSANVRRAAAAAGFSATAVYKRRLKHPRLAAAWDAAMEVGKARIQSYLVEAATQTFDPDELPLGDDRQLPQVSVSEAINIAKMKGGPAASAGAAANDDDWFDSTPITREDWEQARESIVYRLGRLREQMEEQERETGLCYSCGQALPVQPQPA